MYTKTFIPYGGYFSSPFARWQGTLQNENALELGAATAKRWLTSKNIDPKIFEYVYVGNTVGQLRQFHAGQWGAALIGATQTPGCHIDQACATATTCMNQAAVGIETGLYETAFCLLTDRMSNSPHTIWPNVKGAGGTVIAENWAFDNFTDPWGGVAMIQSAENSAKTIGGVSREECDVVTLRRYEQYTDALKDDRAFQKRYMFPIEYKKSRKETALLEADEGVTPRTKEGLAGFKAVLADGVHTSGSQTHPADGNGGVILTTREQARALSTDSKVEVQVVSYGFNRGPLNHVSLPIVPAAKMALANAGISSADIKALKTHNPFIVNDIYASRELSFDVMNINNYGSPLIWGHPQGPTTSRAIIEIIEELVILGGGYGLFTGCAAGDIAASLIVKVS
ncbi:MAG: thiolase family protein [Peptococcaceae bacterium]|jgi:acetyl-CoA acetyltransferase|nr:thiolase family protein [Peptococcaceae bacterium]